MTDKILEKWNHKTVLLQVFKLLVKWYLEPQYNLFMPVLFLAIDKSEKIDFVFAPPLQNNKSFGGFFFLANR